ncbi:hypothetical protein [Bacillus marinisedimentorum]|uniref:hypothetical protein n=1 Tax=Bacillus marinisedimentorum TaxID=1821260 RepID=UPI00087300C1|nr:hypothetical protein [Bacillus marinisedimentorum]
MACVNADGTLTGTARKILNVLTDEVKSTDEIAASAGLPMFKVRSLVREMAQSGVVDQLETGYLISEKGMEKLNQHK